MFTGIVEEMGSVVSVEPAGTDSMRLTIEAQKVLGGVGLGHSISVDGVCLTVTNYSEQSFSADVMAQTLNMSALRHKQPGDTVNLERAVSVEARLGGHIVQGHVDDTAVVDHVRSETHWRVIRFFLPENSDSARLLVDQGSICVNGVSLTLSAVSTPNQPGWFEVSLIPETLSNTTLGTLKPDDTVNVETDMVARHIARLYAFALPKKEENHS